MSEPTVVQALIYEPGLFRLSEAYSALVLCATPGFIVSMVGLKWQASVSR